MRRREQIEYNPQAVAKHKSPGLAAVARNRRATAGSKKAFTNLQKEILVAIAMAPVKEAGVYLKLAYLLINTEDDFNKLLKLYKKPLSAATEQEHKVNIHLHYNTREVGEECLDRILHPAPKWEQP